MAARLKVKGIDGRAPPGVEPAASFDSTRENSPGIDTLRTDRLIALSSISVWWCLVNSVNERDSVCYSPRANGAGFGVFYVHIYV